MAKIIHKFYNQNDSLLLPPSLGELIPPAHPVRVVNNILDRLDISGIESTYKGGGTDVNPESFLSNFRGSHQFDPASFL